jgi:hypothetical protein
MYNARIKVVSNFIFAKLKPSQILVFIYSLYENCCVRRALQKEREREGRTGREERRKGGRTREVAKTPRIRHSRHPG